MNRSVSRLRSVFSLSHFLRHAGLISTLLITLAGQSIAAPRIDSVDTSRLQSEGIVVIRGNGFGGAPQIEIYDDFEHVGTSHAQTVVLDQALEGAWTATTRPVAVYDDFAYSGSSSVRTWDNNTNDELKLTKHFDAPIQSTFISYWVAIPPGYPFPGNNADLNGLPTDSCWKFAWLIDEDYQGNSSDLVVPSYVGQGTAAIAGNDLTVSYIAKVATWWSWGNWMRVTAWLSADPTAPSERGHLRFSIFSEEYGIYTLDKSTPVFDADGRTEKEYKRISFPGWIRNFSMGEGRPVYDDIYVASGPNAFARVELSDNADYEKSTRFAIQRPISWSNDTIEFELVDSGLADNPDTAIHLFGADGMDPGRGTFLFKEQPRAPTLTTD